MKLHPLLESLSHGDKRMVKGVDEALESVINDPTLFPVLIDGLSSENKLAAMRSADAVEKLTVINPHWLQPYKNQLLNLVKTANQQEVRWHLCQIIPRLGLTLSERKELIEHFKLYLKDKSIIVITFSMQALVDLSGNDYSMKSGVRPIIKKLMKEGSPAMQSRGKILLKQLSSTV